MARENAILQKGWQGHNPTDHKVKNKNEKGFFLIKHTFDKKGVNGDHNGLMEDR